MPSYFYIPIFHIIRTVDIWCVFWKQTVMPKWNVLVTNWIESFGNTCRGFGMFQQAVQSMNRHLHWKRFKKVSLNYPFEATEWDCLAAIDSIYNCQRSIYCFRYTNLCIWWFDLALQSHVCVSILFNGWSTTMTLIPRVPPNGHHSKLLVRQS